MLTVTEGFLKKSEGFTEMSSRILLSSVINSSFLNRFSQLASTQTTAQSLRGEQDTTSVSDGLRRGAQIYAQSVQSVNAVISLVNLSDKSLSELEGITDKLIDLAERGTSSNISRQDRRLLDTEYRKLAENFQKIVADQQSADNNLLSRDLFEGILTNIGLSPDAIPLLGTLFDSIKTQDDGDLLADSDAQGVGRAKLPASLVASGVKRAPSERSLFDPSTTFSTRADAYEILHDLKALKDQISTNREVFTELRGFLGENLTLVRETGLAMLEIDDQLLGDKEASEVADLLRNLIRRNAGKAIAQARNLDPLAVAALTIDDSNLS